MASNSTFWLIIISYFVVLFISFMVHKPFLDLPAKKDGETIDESILNSAPIVGKKNITNVIKQRSKVVKDDFEKMLQHDGWKILRTGVNVSVEILEPNNTAKWPLYIKTTTNIPASPKDVFSMFDIQRLEETIKAIDPFFEKISLLFEPSKEYKVIRRTTPKIALLPKRDFTLALSESTQQKPVSVLVTNAKHSPLKLLAKDIQITKGTLYQEYVSIKPNSDYPLFPYPTNSKYIKSFQDTIVWYLDDRNGGTNMISLMQVDLGHDVPKWLFRHTVGGIGVWSVHALIKLTHRKFAKPAKS